MTCCARPGLGARALKLQIWGSERVRFRMGIATSFGLGYLSPQPELGCLFHRSQSRVQPKSLTSVSLRLFRSRR